MSIQEQLKTIIRTSGMQITTIERATGIHRVTLYDWRAGRHDLAPHNIDRLCEYLRLELRPRSEK